MLTALIYLNKSTARGYQRLFNIDHIEIILRRQRLQNGVDVDGAIMIEFGTKKQQTSKTINFNEVLKRSHHCKYM